MNFETVIDRVVTFLDEERLPRFLIGGLAMHAYGASRLTKDVDFLTLDEARNRVVRFMEEGGYETLHSSTGFSNHLHEDEEWGRVDFVFSSRETIEKLEDARTRTVTIADHEIPVPSAEHLVAMKVLAIRNEPRRTLGEMSDIQHLMTLPETDLEMVREQFQKHGLLRRYDEIKEVAF